MFHFTPFKENHLPVLRQWLRADHIKDFWQETEDDEKLKIKFMEELPRRGVFAYVISKDSSLVGYIQYYDAKKVGGGWWEAEKDGTFGIDLMIGVPDYVGQGFGSQIIGEFISFIRSREPSVRSIIIDPDPSNGRAIRAFEKAGFIREMEVKTPGGAALLMRFNLSE